MQQLHLDILEQALTIIAAALPIVGGIFLFIKRLRIIARINKAFRDIIIEASRECIIEQLKPLNAKIDEVYEQITVNGYRKGTLRDKLGQIDDAIHMLMLNQRTNIDNSPQPRFECDANGKCTWVNEALCALFGQSFNEMISADGSGWLASIEEPEKVFEVWSEAVCTKIPYYKEYVVRNDKLKKRIKCIARAKPLLSRDGTKVITWHGVVTPVSEGDFNFLI